MTNHREPAREAVLIEAEAIAALADRLDDSFDRAVEAILHCKGRVIVAGMGKSGLVGKKITATLNSTGIASFFLHPAEAMHGDLGLIRSEDVLLLISKSGRAGEMDMIVSAARRLGLVIMILCGTMESELCRRADIVLDCSVTREAGPNDLIPTASSTTALVMGDALAVALLQARKFTTSDFANLHPGGFIGKRLLKRVSELHHTGDEVPFVAPDASMKEMILEMTGKRLGCVVMTDGDGRTAGVFTDGDLRRLAEKRDDFYRFTADEVMVRNPKTISADAILDAALAVMEKHTITQLVTVDRDDRLLGIIHLHDILRSKLV
ncbi:MAG: KpsF/GutQ family sugar-phosphate isomerase [candidate division Zixibacteria bacterium]|nr:KpsF/GutQ family sugar-phosphate isomerase [candidate division Zixibacteria bacterium]